MEEDRLRETLATLYRNGRERMAGLDDAKQREFVENRFAQGDLVYAVWLDASKPRNMDYEVLKGSERQSAITTMAVVPCNDRVRSAGEGRCTSPFETRGMIQESPA